MSEKLPREVKLFVLKEEVRHISRIDCATNKCKRLAKWWYHGDNWCTKDLKRILKVHREYSHKVKP